MNLAETGELLAFIQALDGRRVDEVVILRWQGLLADVDDLELAKEAVNLHDRETPAFIKPAHVLANVERIRNPWTTQPGNVDFIPDVGATAAAARLATRRTAPELES